MKHGTFLFFALTYSSAFAALPTVGHVSDYFEQICHNPDLIVPGAGNSNLVSNSYLLQLIDTLNDGKTTHSADVETDSVVSLGYLTEVSNLLGESMTCCMAGAIDEDSKKCLSCGVWTWDDNTQCPPGFGYISLENTVWAATSADCPVGTEVYYDVPDICSGEIF